MNFDFSQGDSAVEVRGSIILLTPVGTFNEEGTKLMVNKIEQAIADFDGGSFGIFLDATQLIVHTPCGCQLLEKHNNWLHRQKLIAKAVLVTSLTQHKVTKTYIPSVVQQNEKEFTDREKALTWLLAELSAEKQSNPAD